MTTIRHAMALIQQATAILEGPEGLEAEAPERVGVAAEAVTGFLAQHKGLVFTTRELAVKMANNEIIGRSVSTWQQRLLPLMAPSHPLAKLTGAGRYSWRHPHDQPPQFKHRGAVDTARAEREGEDNYAS